MFPRLTDNDARRPLPIIHNGRGVIRDIYHHVGRTEIAREPTPALHIGNDCLNARSRDFGLTASVLLSAL